VGIDALRVAVGVLLDAHGRVLVSRRHEHLHQGGLWEFPGGKIHSGESVFDALVREFAEELGLHVEAAEPMLALDHDYTDRRVRLEVWRITRFTGEARGLEAQPVEWRPLRALDPADFPAANAPIVAALGALAITDER
jgi:8-oxo-dGTP diphosphatase